MSINTTELSARIQQSGQWIQPLRSELKKVIIGQEGLVDRLLIAMLTNGHVLLEGVPGLAKTLTIKSLAATLSATFKRIQFTPDLLPADVIGTLIYNPRDGSFSEKLGPVFANLVLADEINRAPAKVQSALLEAMQERQVTIGEKTYELPDPFLVLATQNPLDQEGTYSLPEAQLDRFLLKVHVDYPGPKEERRILDLMSNSASLPEISAIVDPAGVVASRALVNDVFVDDAIKDYIVRLIIASRKQNGDNADPEALRSLHPYIRCGASPRGTISLTLAARAQAFLNGRGYVVPEDVRSLAHDVLRHRVLLTYEAEAEDIDPAQIIDRLLEAVPAP
ncbi:MAG: MoxR family ATPase [Verrucomicrobiota bacterium]